MLILTSCNSPTKPDNYTVSGVVYDNNNQPLANAVVLLYESVVMSDENSQMKSLYPNHGASAEFYLLFDHRRYQPVAMINADMNGEFILKNVRRGKYNIVSMKEDYGLQYRLDMMIDSSLSDLQIVINPLIEIPSVVHDTYSLVDNRSYYSVSDVQVLPEGRLIVGTGVVLYMNPGSNLDIYGTLQTDSSASLKISTKDRLFSYDASEAIERFESVTFHNQDSKSIRNISIDFSVLGTTFWYGDGSSIENFSVNAFYQGFAAVGVSNFSMKNSSVNGSSETIRAGANFENSNTVVIEKCHFWGNVNGLLISGTPNATVYNNYFNNNSNRDVFIAQDGSGLVHYNTFRHSNTAIYNFRGQIQADYNDIEANIGVYSDKVDAWFSAQFNNLNCSQYGIKSRCMYYSSPIVHLDGSRNYWFTSDAEEIAALIYDRNSDSVDDVNYHLLLTVVDYLPFSYSPNPAGVFNQ
jgi:hypothetical protein